MVKSLVKKSLREIRRNFLQYLAMILIVTLATTLWTGLSASSLKLEKRAETLFSEGNLADLWVTTTGLDESDLAFTQKLASQKNFDYEQRLFVTASVASTRTLGAYLIVTEDSDPQISKCVSGFTPDGLMIDKALAHDLDVSEGDTVTLTVQGYSFDTKIDSIVVNPETVSANTVICGSLFMTKDTFIRIFTNMLVEQYGFLSRRMCENIAKSKLFYNQIVISGYDDASVFESHFAEKDSSNLLSVFTRDTFPSVMVVYEDIRQSKNICYVLPVAFFMVALLVIVTTCTQMVMKEHKLIGAMQAIGLSKKEILNHYLVTFFTVVLIGCILGNVIGPLLIPSVMNVKYGILYILPEVATPIPWLPLSVCCAVFLGITALATVAVCTAELAEHPALSMRGQRKSPHHARAVTKKLPIPIPLKLAMRNLEMKKGRAILVVIGILSCTAMLVCGFGINDCIDASLSLEVDTNMPYSIKITAQEDYCDAIYAKALTIDGIEGAEQLCVVTSTVHQGEQSTDTELYIVEPSSRVLGGQVAQTGLTLTERTANDLGVSVGSAVTVSAGKIEFTETVAAIVPASITNGIFMVQAEEFQRFEPTIILVYTKDGASLSSIRNELDATDGVISAMTRNEMLDFIDSLLSGISLITLTITVFSILLAALVLFNLIRLGFSERASDTAMMKAIGMNRFEIALSLIFENGILTLAGLILGLPCGFPFMKLVLGMNETVLVSYVYTVFPASYIISALIVFCVWVLVNLLFCLRLDKVPMTDSLKERE